MKKGVIIGIILGLLIILGVVSYNSLVTKKENIDAKMSEIDVQLKRRSDLIPNLVNTVRGYMKHEQAAINSVAAARSALAEATSTDDKFKASNELTSAINNLFVIVENYPELKADKTFINLQDELAGTENRIAYARKEYNTSVKSYNTTIKRFPTNLFAKILGFEQASYFEASESEKENVNVNFD